MPLRCPVMRIDAGIEHLDELKQLLHAIFAIPYPSSQTLSGLPSAIRS